MARSLTVKHDELPQTSSLLNAFLALAVGWLFLGMLFAGMNAEADTPVGDLQILDLK